MAIIEGASPVPSSESGEVGGIVLAVITNKDDLSLYPPENYTTGTIIKYVNPNDTNDQEEYVIFQGEWTPTTKIFARAVDVYLKDELYRKEQIQLFLQMNEFTVSVEFFSDLPIPPATYEGGQEVEDGDIAWVEKNEGIYPFRKVAGAYVYVASQTKWKESVQYGAIMAKFMEIDSQLDSKYDKTGGTIDGSVNLTTGNQYKINNIDLKNISETLTNKSLSLESNNLTQTTINPINAVFANGDKQEVINNKAQGQINKLIDTGRDKKVCPVLGLDTNDGINNPYKTIQYALDNNGFGSLVSVGSGEPLENITFNDTVLNGKYSNRILYGQASTGSFATAVRGNLTITGQTTRVRIKDIQFGTSGVGGKITIDGGQGRHYFDNVYFANGLDAINSIQRWQDFRQCSGTGVVSLGEVGSPLANTSFLFEDCDFSGITDFRIGHQNLTVKFRNCRRLPRKITHLKGTLIFENQNNIESALDSSNWLESTCNSGEGSLIINKGFSSKQTNGTFARINKTGTCNLTLGSIEIDFANDILTGTITYLKDTHGQNIYGLDLSAKQDFISTVNSQSAMLALTGIGVGYVVIRTDLQNAFFRLNTLPASTLGNWSQVGGSQINTLNFQETNTVFVDATYGLNSNDGLSIYSKVQTIAQALAVAGNNWLIKVLGDTSYSYTGNITQTGLVLDLGEATLSGTVNNLASNVVLKNGTFTGTLNDNSSGSVIFQNINLNNSTINHLGSGSKIYNNILTSPSLITTQNGTGTLTFNNCVNVMTLTINGGWSIKNNNSLLNINSTSTSNIVTNNLQITSVISNQTELDAISVNGYYVLNFDNPTISGLTGIARGDIVEKQTSKWVLIYKAKTISTITVGVNGDTFIFKDNNWTNNFGGISETTLTGTDLNTVIQTGEYKCNGVTNSPPSRTNGYLTVRNRTNDFVYQEFMVLDTNSQNTNETYTRARTTAGWGTWNLVGISASTTLTPNSVLATDTNGKIVASATVITANSRVALYYTGTNASETNYPQGHIIFSLGGLGFTRNNGGTAYRSTINNNRTFQIQAPNGVALGGLWKSGGANSKSVTNILLIRYI